MATFVGEAQTRLFQIRAQISALELEGKGIRFRKSVLAHVKRQHNLKGNRERVLAGLRLKFEQLQCAHEWTEMPGEPPVDVCGLCGLVRQ
jgi:hypothetical protein